MKIEKNDLVHLSDIDHLPTSIKAALRTGMVIAMQRSAIRTFSELNIF